MKANYALSIEEYLEALRYSIKVIAENSNNIEAIIILGTIYVFCRKNSIWIVEIQECSHVF